MAPIDAKLVPNSPGPLNIDAERYLEAVRPLPTSGTVFVRSRVIGIHPRGRGNGFVEFESEVTDSAGAVYMKMVNGSFRRGVKALGDIEPFAGAGQTFSQKIAVPERAPDVTTTARVADNQAHIYRLSGDYNPLHIDPDAARFAASRCPSCTVCVRSASVPNACSASGKRRSRAFRKIKVRFSRPCS